MPADGYDTRMMFEVIGSEKLHVFEEFANRPEDNISLDDLKRMTDLGPTVLEPMLDDFEARDVIFQSGQRDGETLYRLNTSDDHVRIAAQKVVQFVVDVAEAEEARHAEEAETQ